MNKAQNQEKPVSEKILGELEVAELITLKVKDLVEEVRALITSNGDPEQNVRDNALLIDSKFDNELDFYRDELEKSTDNISDLLAKTVCQDLGIEKFEDDYWDLRHLASTNKLEADTRKQD